MTWLRDLLPAVHRRLVNSRFDTTFRLPDGNERLCFAHPGRAVRGLPPALPGPRPDRAARHPGRTLRLRHRERRPGARDAAACDGSPRATSARSLALSRAMPCLQRAQASLPPRPGVPRSCSARQQRSCQRSSLHGQLEGRRRRVRCPWTRRSSSTRARPARLPARGCVHARACSASFWARNGWSLQLLDQVRRASCPRRGGRARRSARAAAGGAG